MNESFTMYKYFGIAAFSFLTGVYIYGHDETLKTPEPGKKMHYVSIKESLSKSKVMKNDIFVSRC